MTTQAMVRSFSQGLMTLAVIFAFAMGLLFLLRRPRGAVAAPKEAH